MEDLKQSIANSNLIYAAMCNFPNPVLQVEESENDSDKIITVPADKIWEILWIHVEYISTATVGDRIFEVLFLDDSDDVIFRIRTSSHQAASLSRIYEVSQNGQEPAFTDTNRQMIPIPTKSLLPAGYKLRIWDSAAIDAAADDMIIKMMVNQWDVS